MLRHRQVFVLHRDSQKEKEYLGVEWRDGKLTVRYSLHEPPGSEEMYLEKWEVDCPEPLVTVQQSKSANLQQALDDLEGR